MRRVAVLDACVLYPAPLRDFLMSLATAGLFHARWTERIHEEWMTNLLEQRPDLSRDRLERTRQLMDAAVPDCLVSGHDELVETLSLPDPDDRHVLAAAIHGAADVIVTWNLQDFPADILAGHGVEVQDPDSFICELIESDAETACLAMRRHRARLRNPPKSVDQYFDDLERQNLHATVARIREFAEQI